MTTDSPSLPQPTPAAWLWPLRLSAGSAQRLLRQLQRFRDRLGSVWRWWLAGVLIGTLPLLFDFLTGLSLSRLATALLLTPMFVAAVAADAPTRGLGTVAVAFAAHSVLAIGFFAQGPERLGIPFPAGLDYWHESQEWIRTGVSREYEVSWWLPAHGQLLAAMLLFAYTSLGFIPFWQGLYEVDLMNCYVGQLLAHADHPTAVLLVGWHPWSLCRGVGYLFLTFEIASLSLARLTGTRLSTTARRRRRWMLGLGFLALDGLLKFFLLDPVRQLLAGALSD